MALLKIANLSNLELRVEAQRYNIGRHRIPLYLATRALREGRLNSLERDHVYVLLTYEPGEEDDDVVPSLDPIAVQEVLKVRSVTLQTIWLQSEATLRQLLQSEDKSLSLGDLRLAMARKYRAAGLLIGRDSNILNHPRLALLHEHTTLNSGLAAIVHQDMLSYSSERRANHFLQRASQECQNYKTLIATVGEWTRSANSHFTLFSVPARQQVTPPFDLPADLNWFLGRGLKSGWEKLSWWIWKAIFLHRDHHDVEVWQASVEHKDEGPIITACTSTAMTLYRTLIDHVREHRSYELKPTTLMMGMPGGWVFLPPTRVPIDLRSLAIGGDYLHSLIDDYVGRQATIDTAMEGITHILNDEFTS